MRQIGLYLVITLICANVANASQIAVDKATVSSVRHMR